MTRNQKLALIGLGFVLGDLEGVVRANIHAKREAKKLRKQNMLLELKLQTMLNFATTFFRDDDPEKAEHDLEVAGQFIDIVEHES